MVSESGQCRDHERNYVEPIEKVASELSGRHALNEATLRGGDNPNVHRPRSDPGIGPWYFVRFQEPKQQCLHRRTELFDSRKDEHSAVGQLR